ncbi:MAG: 2-phosphosulfolactate phosphatase [Nitrospirota bacterium]
MPGHVVIDCFPESAQRYGAGYAVVVVDVIRATTTAVTAAHQGRRVFPAKSTDDAQAIASRLTNPLLVGELGGHMPYGFDMTNSPAQLSARRDTDRPIVLVSSSGIQLLLNAAGCDAVFVACFRNLSAVARLLDGQYERIALLGAGTRGQFRREDQMGCAWIAEKLLQRGYGVGSEQTLACMTQWHGASPDAVRWGRSADYLERTGQREDLDFILKHIDDLDIVPMLKAGELITAGSTITSSRNTGR